MYALNDLDITETFTYVSLLIEKTTAFFYLVRNFRDSTVSGIIIRTENSNLNSIQKNIRKSMNLLLLSAVGIKQSILALMEELVRR